MNFELFAGDSAKLEMLIEDSDGSSLDLSTSTVTWSAVSLEDGTEVTLTEGSGVTVLSGSPTGAVTVDIAKNTFKVIGGWRHQLEAVDGAVSRTLVSGYIRVSDTNRPTT